MTFGHIAAQAGYDASASSAAWVSGTLASASCLVGAYVVPMRLFGIVAVLALSFSLVACASSHSSPMPATTTSPAAKPTKYYVSIGDSYAAGYQPTGTAQGHTTTEGFANDVVSISKANGTDYALVNFGCGGATSDSILSSPGCEGEMRAVGAPQYSVPQAQAAEDFMKAHPGQIALVTVSIGGNDITSCGEDANPVSCLSTRLPKVAANIKTLLTGVRQQVGDSTPIVGITYPDVFLGEKVSGPSTLADLSVVGFQTLINPTLKGAYQAANAKFADVTQATGAYGSMSETTTVAPYGKLPTPVAKVCQLTYYCQYKDIHPKTAGYELIGQLVVDSLKP
jgi:lysophospholipase L1-like esterase